MNETLVLALSVVAGVGLGALFFGGLWWTLRKALASSRSAVWFLGSLVVRTAIVLTAFFAIGRGDWKRLFGCLVGFIIGRFVVLRLTRGTAASDVLKEVGGAPHT